jgi:alginate O-acetyltransferase complex protein AlgI
VLFTEPSFLFYFLPALLVLHELAPRTGAWRNVLLLVASLLFYGWGEPLFVIGLLVAIGWSWGLALAAASAREGGDSHLAAALTGCGIAGILSLLAFFKYAGFAIANANELLARAGLTTLDFDGPALPIGISFFSFQAISYLVDAQRGRAPAQRSPLDTALYIAMFPQLIAGPIVRYEDIAAQLREREVTLEDFAYGTRRFAIGLGKKILIANSLAPWVDRVFAAAEAPLGIVPGPADLSVTLAWLAAVAYALQIYFDFSGYSDMAIGLARLFGFRYRENFAYPFVSASITEFWRRWHISLSSWFRDYLYLPLGGSRRGALRTHANLWIVFLLCGLWHGAQWTFVAWGAWHGLWLSVERLTLRERVATRLAPVRIALTFLIVVVGFVIFRADTLAAAAVLLGAMAGIGIDGASPAWVVPALPVAEFWDREFALVLLCAAIGATPAPAALGRRLLAATRRSGPVANAASALQAVMVAALLFACATRIAAGTYDPFIYFRF